MAEILLSLTIIGVVAAITLPSLTGNINERTWNTQRKALYARISQAVALMPALNGYGTLTENGSGSVTEDNATETFIADGLSKVIKINNICDSDHLADCGLPEKVIPYSGSAISFPTNMLGMNSIFNGNYYTSNSGNPINYSYSQINTNAAAFETANGESIAVYYNPHCIVDQKSSGWHFTQPLLCANLIYDLNGNKGPNTVGKDIGFISVMYPTDPVVVAPLPVPMGLVTSTRTDAGKLCKEKDPDYRLPSIDELTSMFYNRKLLDSSESLVGGYWSASVSAGSSSMTNWIQHFGGGFRYLPNPSMNYYVHCVKR